MSIAEENNYLDLLLKGQRHLFGIYSEIAQETKANEMFDKINNTLNKIPDGTDKDSIIAGLDYAKAKSLTDSSGNNFEIALEKAISSQKKYFEIKNFERYVKTFDLIAEIYIKVFDYNKAESILHKGIEEAKKYQRKERHLKMIISMLNVMGSKIKNDDEYRKEEYFKDEEQAETIYKDGKKVLEDINNEELEEKLKQTYKKFKKIIKYQSSNI